MWQFYYKTTEGSVKAYHITATENVQSILQNGLIAKECKATTNGDYRQSAVYVFAARQDAYDVQLRTFLFDNPDSVTVIEVSIPEDYHHLLREDGLFNMSALCSDNSFPTAMQYIDNIPAAWLKVQS